MINRICRKLLQRGSLFSLTTYGLMLVLPISFYLPLNPLPVAGIIPIFISPALYITDIFVLILLLTRLISWRELPPDEKCTFSNRSFVQCIFPIVFIVLLGLVSIASAMSTVVAIYTVLRWLIALGLYLTLLCTPLPTKKIILFFLIGLGIQAVIGLGQFMIRSPLGIPGELALPVNISASASFSYNGLRWLRAYGMTFHPNVLGGFLGVGLLLSLAMLSWRWFTPLFWLLGIGMLATLSRSAGLFCVLLLPVTAVWLIQKEPRLRRQILITLGGALGVGIIFIIALWGVFLRRVNPLSTNAEMTSLSGRGELIRLALKAIASDPVTGIGAGNFPFYISCSDSPVQRHPVHNIPLLLAAEIGTLGGILWYMLWLIPPLMLFKRWRSLSIWAIPLTAAWFFLGLISLWDYYPWGLENGRLLSVFLLALCHKELI
jgi:O-antigen ligase